MPEESSSGTVPMDAGSVPGRRSGRGKSRAPGRAVPAGVREINSQVTLSVPRELLAAFDESASSLGVVRAQLLREALELYAALLQSGQRTFRHPAYRRVA